MPQDRARDHTLVLLVALLAAWFLIESVSGHVFVKTSCLYERHYPWRNWGTAHVSTVGQGCDMIEEGLPSRAFAASQFARGSLPLWNPAVVAGMPFLAAPATGVLSPFSLVFALVPMPLAITVAAFLQIAAAAVLMALFLREIGAAPFAASCGAVLFALNGVFLELPNHGANVGTGAWLPLAALACVKWWKTERARYLLLGAAAVALQVLGGHYELVLYSVALLAGLGIVLEARAAGRWRARSVRIALWVGALGVGLQLAAVQLLPFLELGRLSQREPFEATQVWFPRWLSLVELVVPIENGAGHFTSVYQLIFIGVLPMVAMMAWRPRRTAVLSTYCLVVALAVLLIGFGVPGLATVYSALVPTARSTNRLFFLFHFCVAVVVALELSRLTDAGDGERRRLARFYQAGAGVAVLALVIIWGVAELAGQPAIRGSVARSLNAVRTMPSLEGMLGDVVTRFRVPDPASVVHLLPLYVGIIAVIVAALAARTTSLRSRRWLEAGLVVALLVSPVHFTLRVGHFGRLAELFPESETVARLKQAGPPSSFRVISLDGAALHGTVQPLEHPGFTSGRVFSGNLPSVYGFHTVGGYQALYPGTLYRALRLAEPTLKRDCRMDSCNKVYFTNALDLGSPVLTMLNVRFILARADVDLADRGVRLVARSSRDGIAIWENPRALGRAYLVHDVVDGSDSQLAALRDVGFDPAKTVALPASVPPTTSPRGDRDRVEMVRYEPREVALRTATATPGFLVLADNYFPGWRAWVDGQATPVLRANYFLRAVAIPPGEHDVVFRYEPASLRWGTTLTLLSPVSAGLLVIARRLGGDHPPAHAV